MNPLQRRDLSASQRAAIAVFYAGPVYKELMGELKVQADKARKANLKHNAVDQESFPDRQKGQWRDQYGKKFNVNGRYISDLETLRTAIAKLDDLAKKPEADWKAMREVERPSSRWKLFHRLSEKSLVINMERNGT